MTFFQMSHHECGSAWALHDAVKECSHSENESRSYCLLQWRQPSRSPVSLLSLSLEKEAVEQPGLSDPMPAQSLHAHCPKLLQKHAFILHRSEHFWADRVLFSEQYLIIQWLAASLKTSPMKVFQRLRDLMAATAYMIPLGLLHIRMWTASILAQSPHSMPRLAPGMAFCWGKPSLCQSCSPLDNLLLLSSMHTVGTDLQKEGGYNRRLHLRLGDNVVGQFSIRLLVNPGSMSQVTPP